MYIFFCCTECQAQCAPRCGNVSHALWAAFAYCLLSVVIIHDDVRAISRFGKSLHNIRNMVQGPLFFNSKVCSVLKVCSVCFLSLQKFVEFDVSEQLTLAKQVFIIQSLCPPDIYITLTNGKTAYGLGRGHSDI